MDIVVLALGRSLADLRVGRVWLYLLLPALAALLLAVVLGFSALGWLIAQLLELPPMTLLVAWGLVWLAQLLAWLGGWMALFALAYLCAMLIAAVFIMPLLLKHLAEGEYRDLAAMGRDSFVAATVNSLGAATLFIIAWLVTIPLWLIPGMSLLVPLLLMAWLNRRTFAYDALAMHATDAEWASLRAQYRWPLFMLGLVMALLAHVPIIGLLVPTLAALSFVHFGLEALRRQRGGAIVSIQGERS